MSAYQAVGLIGLGVIGRADLPRSREEERQHVSRSICRGAVRRGCVPTGADRVSVADVIERSESLFLCLPAPNMCAGFEGDGVENMPSGQVVVDRHVVGQPDRDLPGSCRPRALPGPMRRSRARDGGAGRHARRDRRRDACAYADIEPLIRCFATERHPLRRGRRGAGHEDPQQHGAVRNRQRAGRGGCGRQT